jgi:hypothetical protein
VTLKCSGKICMLRLSRKHTVILNNIRTFKPSQYLSKRRNFARRKGGTVVPPKRSEWRPME